ncbi:MAG: ATP-dependent nuclease [Gaiellales bacterium]
MRGYRTARDVSFSPGELCALVGEASAGKSNLLSAIRLLLDPSAPSPTDGDMTGGAGGKMVIEGRLASGARLRTEATPPLVTRSADGAAPTVAYMPAELRAGPVVSGGRFGEPSAHVVAQALTDDAHGRAASPAASAVSLVHALEACCQAAVTGLILLIEEPELYLRPQGQRYLYRLLRDLAASGNQVIYSTHAPTFLNVGRLEELAFVTHDRSLGIRVHQPQPFAAESDFRVLTEFDAERSELFLARAVVLVEGATEKLTFPFIFRALGHDPDREAISIVECGGKSNIPLFAHVCDAAGIPFVAVHDRDAPTGRRPISAERVLNARIARAAGAERTVVLVPDFEAVAGLPGRSHKPEHAWRRFVETDAKIPEQLARAAGLAVTLARD